MADPAIVVQHLSKSYQIGASQPYRTLRDTVADACSAALRAVTRRGRPESGGHPTIWALNDVSLQIGRGEVVGVIGRNGAGKSTLLKVLSRIAEPTLGEVDLFGRVGTLLEVGTGFHNELTGRENIYLNGAILGMKKAEIQRRFDEMVSFAEVERFIDTPVKHYSTGMYLRLAFAVAAHLEPEVLLVDEVLAVGDLAFQKKCLGKMGEVAQQGRTILFVSHNMGAVRSLCAKGVVLNEGRVVCVDGIASAIQTYYRLLASEDRDAAQAPVRQGFRSVALTSHDGSGIRQGEPFEVGAEMHIREQVAGFTLLCIMDDMQQRRVFHMRRDSTDFRNGSSWLGSYRVRVRFPALWMEPGLYSVYFKILFWGQHEPSKLLSDVLQLDVNGSSCGWGSVLSPSAEWRVESQPCGPESHRWNAPFEGTATRTPE